MHDPIFSSRYKKFTELYNELGGGLRGFDRILNLRLNIIKYRDELEKEVVANIFEPAKLYIEQVKKIKVTGTPFKKGGEHEERNEGFEKAKKLTYEIFLAAKHFTGESFEDSDKDYAVLTEWIKKRTDLNEPYQPRNKEIEENIKTHADNFIKVLNVYSEALLTYKVMHMEVVILDVLVLPDIVALRFPEVLSGESKMNENRENRSRNQLKSVSPKDQEAWIIKQYDQNRDNFDTDDEWATDTTKKFKTKFKTNIGSPESMKRYARYKGFN